PSDSVPQGSVISTDPAPGTSVERDSVVRIVVSSGPEQVEVPNVTDQPESAATSRLESRGLNVEVRVESVPAGDPRDGRVIRQAPSGGRVDRGTTVVIVVGVESAPTTTTTTTQPSEGDG